MINGLLREVSHLASFNSYNSIYQWNCLIFDACSKLCEHLIRVFLLILLVIRIVFTPTTPGCMHNMNSFVEYTFCNRPGTGAYSAPKSGYNPHHHHLHHPHHPLDQHQGFPVAPGAFHTGPTGPAAAINGTRGDSSGGAAAYTGDGRLYGGAGNEGAHGGTGTTQHHQQHPHHLHEQQQHQQNDYHHPHLHQTQSLQSGTPSPYSSGSSGAYAEQACARSSEYVTASGPASTVHSQYYMEEPVASAYYHQAALSNPAPTGGPSYGALAGTYCGPQGALAGSQYPQQLVGGLDAAGYLGLPHGGGYGELPVSQDRERGGEEGQPAGQGQTFDWMKVKRNPPKTGTGGRLMAGEG